MSTYVREKVLRIPMERLNMSKIKNYIAEKYPDYKDDFPFCLDIVFPTLFDYATERKFQIAPTEESYIDYVLEYEYDADGDYGKTRALYDCEKEKYLPVFQQLDPNVNMDYVRLVEFCWYNYSEAPGYYDDVNDPFYEVI